MCEAGKRYSIFVSNTGRHSNIPVVLMHAFSKIYLNLETNTVNVSFHNMLLRK